MNSLKNVLFAFVSVISVIAFGQTSNSLQFVPTWHGKPLSLPLQYSDSDSIRISLFRFYVHAIRLERSGQVVWDSGDQHYLVDFTENSSVIIPLGIPQKETFDFISFTLGVDSALQVSGAHSGALDPINGMYWTWQSGYIALKLEAEIEKSNKQEMIQWHVGGYRNPYITERVVRKKRLDDNNFIRCGIELDKLLIEGLNSCPISVMSPSDAAIQLADLFAMCFYWLPQ